MITTERAEQDHAIAAALAGVWAALLRSEHGRALFTEVVPEVFPWVRFLPPRDRRDFVAELVAAATSFDGLDLGPVAQTIVAWQHTAEVHADPELAALLRQDADDHGPVPEPGR